MMFPNYYFRYNPFYNQYSKKNFMKDNFTENSGTPSTSSKGVNLLDKNDYVSYKRKKSPKYNYFNFSNLFSSNLEDPILEIFGIKLYFDDILIISLLLFLYKEGVQDEMLFICLILLLLS